MTERSSTQAMQNIWRDIGLHEPPTLHVVLGSGYGNALKEIEKDGWKKVGEVPFQKIPGLVSATVQDHAGIYSFFKKENRSVCFQMGRLHGYEGHPPAEVVQTVMIPRLAGVKNFILTNAAGGLNKNFKPGDVMLIADHVNFTGKNPLLGPNPMGVDGNAIGERFPDLSTLYEKKWNDELTKLFKAEKLKAHGGIYLGTLGPSFETPAEVNLYAKWGMDAVGMSTVWEAIALKHSGARLAGVSLISNPCAGLIPGLVLHHEQILETCRGSAARIVAGILGFLETAEDL